METAPSEKRKELAHSFFSEALSPRFQAEIRVQKISLCLLCVSSDRRERARDDISRAFVIRLSAFSVSE